MAPKLPDSLQSLVTDNNAVYDQLLTARSIRSIIILPGDPKCEVQCLLSVVDLDHIHPFHALSYCWGREIADEPIFCNGNAFKVTRNLFDALKRLRSATETRRMWIDAISINQDSIAERNHQVPLMAQIYKKASQVVVWLGEADDTSALALQTIQRICKACFDLTVANDFANWLLSLETDHDAWNTIRTDVITEVIPDWPGEPQTCSEALRHFFNRPWFSRVWVIQEVRGCPHINVRVGDTVTPWSMIALTAAWVVYAPSPITLIKEPYKFGGFLHTDVMQQKTMVSFDDVPYLELLDRARGLQVTIPQDRIFALLHHSVSSRDGVESQKKPYLDLTVDYNMDLAELYRQIALRSILQTNSLQILSHALEDSHKRNGYPSWVPVWHTMCSRFIGPRRTFLYNATGDQTVKLKTDAGQGRIVLDGIVCGKVLKTSIHLFIQPTATRLETVGGGTRFPSAINYASFRQHVDVQITARQKLEELSHLIVRECWQPDHNWHQSYFCRSKDTADVHFTDFCAFVAERLHPGVSHISLHGRWCHNCRTRHVSSPAGDDVYIFHCNTCDDTDTCRSCHNAGYSCPGGHTLSRRPLPSMLCHFTDEEQAIVETNSSGDASRFDLSVRESFDQQVFIEMDTGHIGVGSQATLAGDLVVLFFGARVPFILKQHDDFYTLAGECYVQGLMDGEAVEAWEKGDMSSQQFVLA